MFRTTRRKLALLNVGLVALIVATVVLLTYVALKTSLDREADKALDERIAVATRTWATELQSPNPTLAVVPTPSGGDDDEHDDEGEQDDLHEALETGDTLIFVYARDGSLIANERGVASATLPIEDAVQRARNGKTDSRTIVVDGDTLRVRTRPAIIDDQVVGVVQAARSDREHISELNLVRNIGLAGLVLGLLVAFPTGLYLSRRAMAPISLAFERQREFVADASHELKTPLSVIRANVELISREPEMPPVEREQELRHVVAEVDNMAYTVNMLVSL